MARRLGAVLGGSADRSLVSRDERCTKMAELKVFGDPDDAAGTKKFIETAQEAVRTCGGRDVTIREYPAWGPEAENVGAVRPPALAFDDEVIWAGSIPSVERLASILRSRLR